MGRRSTKTRAGLLAVWLGSRVPIQDATGRRRFVSRARTPDARTPRLYRRLLVVSLVTGAGALAACLAKNKGWESSSIVGVAVFAVITIMGVLVSHFADPSKHIRFWLAKSVCPWCFSVLPQADLDDRKRCVRCRGQWWDVPGLSRGDSIKTQREHRISVSVLAAMSGLVAGFVLFGAASSGPWRTHTSQEAAIIGAFAVFGLGWGAAGAEQWTIGVSAAVVPVGLGLFWLRGANAENGMVMIIAGAVLGCCGGGAAWLVRRAVPRRLRRGRGRVCAACGYDLRWTRAGRPCPECGSNTRLE